MKWICLILWGLLHPGFDEYDEMKPANYTDALAVLADRNQIEDKMLRIGTLAGPGNYSQALSELNQLTGTTDEIVAFKGYMSAVLQSGNDLMNIPDANYANAIGYVDDLNTSALAMSQGLHFLREEVYHPLIPIVPGLGERSSEANLGMITTAQTSAVVVSPNPFATSISFDFTNVTENGIYTIVANDLSGHSIWDSVKTGNGKVVWDTSNLPAGVYFYRIRSSLGDEVAFGKIVKLSK